MQKQEDRDYLALMKQSYPEELEKGGFVEMIRNRCAYMEKYPEEWRREPKWFREMYKEDPERAVLQYSYEFLESFA